MGKSRKRSEKFKLLVLLSVVFAGIALGVAPKSARAFFGPVMPVFDYATWITTQGLVGVETTERAQDVEKKVEEKIKERWKSVARVAYKNALRVFSTRMAYQVAVDLASAAKGQEPVFWKEKPFRYLEDAADSAAATFIEDLASARVCEYPGIEAERIDPECRTSCIEDCTDDETPNCIEECQRDQCGIGTGTVETTKHPRAGRPCSTDRDCAGGGTCSGGFGFSICEFDPKIQFQIQAGLATDLLGGQVGTSKCSFYEDIWKGLPNRIAEKDFNSYFITNVPNYFKEGNTVTQYISYFNDSIARQQKIEEAASLERIEGQGFRSLDNLIGDILTPGTLFKSTYDVSLYQAVVPESVFTDDILADSIGVFANTLITKYLQLAFTGIDSGSDPKIRFSFSGSAATGRAGARARFASIAQPTFKRGGDISLLNDLASCPVSDRQPNNCAMTEAFRQATEDELRLKDAAPTSDQIVQGGVPLIPRDQLFGFGDGGRVLTLDEGIPYNSIVLLVHHRIVPVSWKLAAEYIRDFDSEPRTLGELMDSFSDPESPYYQLIDPEWVLKAPAAYCQREGFSDILLDEQYYNVSGSENRPKERKVTRQTTCVDERTCIAEDPDSGACRAFGYCTQERSSWEFSGEACDEQFASCQAYYRGDTSEEVAYLTNTLNDSGACEQGNAGCAFYCTDTDKYDYLTDTWSCTDDPEGLTGETTDGLFLDNEAAECPEDQAGCTRLLRTVDGANLVRNSSFEYLPEGADLSDCTTHKLSYDDDGTPRGWIYNPDLLACVTQSTAAFDGLNMYVIPSSPGAHVDYNVGFSTSEGVLDNGGKSYAAQYALKSNSETTVEVQLLVAGVGIIASEQHKVTNAWGTFKIDGELLLSQIGDLTLRFRQVGGDGYAIDAVQLQEGTEATAYRTYGADNVTHMRVLPKKNSDPFDLANLYGCTGDENDDPRCKDFAQVCKIEEVGCELYSPTNGDPVIPGIIGETCNADQAGCQLLRQVSLAGVTVGPLRDIPERGEAEFPITASKAAQCSAVDVGCEEFTNLSNDQGEQLEYYSQIRQCVVTGSGPAQNVNTYLSWTVSENGGYELYEERLLATNLGTNAPCVNLSVSDDQEALRCEDTGDNVTDCSAEYGTEPDCREYTFVSDSGAVEKYYRYASRVVYESAQCDPLRNTLDQSVYFADTERSRTCSAAAASCREFEGNSGSNSLTLFYDQFQTTVEPWTGGILSDQTPIPNQAPPDHSMSILGRAERALNDASAADETYSAEFWAKGAGAANIFLYDSDSGAISYLQQNLAFGDDWGFYRVGPVTLTSEFGAATKLVIESTGDGHIYVDNILLRRISDRLYLLKDSLLTNNAYCTDVGCQQYRDRDGDQHYIQSFKKLCRDKAIGCELFANAQNTQTPYEETFAMNDDQSLTTRVPSDAWITLVNDEEHYCAENYQGCREAGRAMYGPRAIGDDPYELKLTEYKTEYRIVNAENFETAICDSEARACVELITSDTGSTIFVKDPEEALCEFRVPSGGGSANWYLTGVEGDQACPTTELRGEEDADPPVRPDREFVGACPIQQNSCQLYRDPLDPVGCESACPYVEDGGNPVEYFVDETGRCREPVSDPDDPDYADQQARSAPGCRQYPMLSKTLETGCEMIGTEPVAVDQTCKLFRDTGNLSVSTSADVSPSGAAFLCKSSEGTVVGTCTSRDDAACEGVQGQSCEDNPALGAPTACNSEVTDPSDPLYCDSNIAVRVKPDRVCSEWLACKFAEEVNDPQDIDQDNQIKEYQCRQIGTCNALGPDNQCANFVEQEAVNQTADQPDAAGNEEAGYRVGLFDKLKRTTGYGFAGLHWGCSDTGAACRKDDDCAGDAICRIIEGTYALSAMTEVGAQTLFAEMISDGTFENNLLTQFPGACSAGPTQLLDQPCLSDLQCSSGVEGAEGIEPGACTHQPDGNDVVGALGQWRVWDYAGAGRGSIVIEDELIPGEVIPISSQTGADLLDGNNVLTYLPDAGDLAGSFGVEYDVQTQAVAGTYVISFTARSQAAGITSGESVPFNVGLRDNDGNVVAQFADANGQTTLELLNFAQKYVLTKTISGTQSKEVRVFFDSRDGDERHSFTLDNVSMRPVLNYQTTYAGVAPSPSSITASCRAYPEQDGLACSYTDENLVQHNGWGGYCLQPNPNIPQQCLTWWPVDAITGDPGLDPGDPAGYTGATPLYYCLNSKAVTDHGVGKLVSGRGHPDYGYVDGNIPQGLGAVINFNYPPNNDTSYCSRNALGFDNFCTAVTAPGSNPHYFWYGNKVESGRCNAEVCEFSGDISARPGGPARMTPFMSALRKEDVAYFNVYVQKEEDTDWPQQGVIMSLGREERTYDNTSLGCSKGDCKAWSGVDQSSDPGAGEDWVLKFGAGNRQNDANATTDFSDLSCITDAGKRDNFGAVWVYWNEDGRLDRADDDGTITQDRKPFGTRACDAEDDGGAKLLLFAVLNETCTTVAQVSSPARTYAWVENSKPTTPIQTIDERDANTDCLSGLSGSSCFTGYTYGKTGTSDRSPFGAIQQPIGPVETWNGGLASMSQETEPLLIAQNDTNGTKDQARGGLSYSINDADTWTADGGTANYRHCAYGPNSGGAALKSDNTPAGTVCLSDGDCGDGGLCVGSRGVCSQTRAYCDADADCTKVDEYCLIPVVPENRNNDLYLFSVRDRLSFLFTKVLGIWEWDSDARRYTTSVDKYPDDEEAAGNDLQTKWDLKYAKMPICPESFTRPDTQSFDDRPMFYVRRINGTRNEGYCGYEPEVSSVKVNNQTGGALELNHGDTITLTFNALVNPQQRPLRFIAIDWKGDRTQVTGPILWNKQEKSIESDPHKFTYVVTCTDASPCVYEPKVLLVDNWDWCTSADGNPAGYRWISRPDIGRSETCFNENGAWVESGVTVSVNP